jgi:putative ABC transport system permease protein
MSFNLRLILLGAAGVLLLAVLVLALVARVPLKYNARNLVVRWQTTLLAGLSFTVVVALISWMLAFVNGMYRLTKNSGQPGNVVVLGEGATDEAFSSLGFGDIKQIEHYESVLVDETDHLPLASWEVYQVVNQPIPSTRPGNRKRRFLQMRGIDDPARSGRVHNLSLYPGGTWFNPTSDTMPLPGSTRGEQAIQVVLGEGIARELGPDQGKPSLAVGDVFELGDRHWIVVGIMQSAGSTFDSEVWAKRKTVGDLFGKKDTYTTAVLRTAGPEQARATAQYLSANFKPAVQAMPEPDYYDKLNATNTQFLVAAIFIAFWVAVGGVFGVMNTMFATISQRARDIGVLRILGFARWRSFWKR